MGHQEVELSVPAAGFKVWIRLCCHLKIKKGPTIWGRKDFTNRMAAAAAMAVADL